MIPLSLRGREISKYPPITMNTFAFGKTLFFFFHA